MPQLGRCQQLEHSCVVGRVEFHRAERLFGLHHRGKQFRASGCVLGDPNFNFRFLQRAFQSQQASTRRFHFFLRGIKLNVQVCNWFLSFFGLTFKFQPNQVEQVSAIFLDSGRHLRPTTIPQFVLRGGQVLSNLEHDMVRQHVGARFIVNTGHVIPPLQKNLKDRDLVNPSHILIAANRHVVVHVLYDRFLVDFKANVCTCLQHLSLHALAHFLERL